MKAKKPSRKGKPAAKRATKDLPPKKTSDVKGGFKAVEHTTLGGTSKVDHSEFRIVKLIDAATP